MMRSTCERLRILIKDDLKDVKSVTEARVAVNLL
jgi:hypothetical protein